MIKRGIYARDASAYTSSADIIDDVIINLNIGDYSQVLNCPAKSAGRTLEILCSPQTFCTYSFVKHLLMGDRSIISNMMACTVSSMSSLRTTHAHLAKQLHLLVRKILSDKCLYSHTCEFLICSQLWIVYAPVRSIEFIVFSAFVPQETCHSFGMVKDYIPWIGYSVLEFLPETYGIKLCFNASRIYMYLRMALTTLYEKKIMVHTSKWIRYSI